MVKSRIGMAAAALATALAFQSVAADAQYWGGPRDGYYAGDRGYAPPPPRAYYDTAYEGYYDGPPPAYRHHHRRDHCDRGTGGTIIGAIAGGLLGNAVAGRGDRGIGTVVGAGAGALAGRSIDRDC